MADIRPFHALRFNPSKVNVRDALTQPYDKITPAMQDAYYRQSPHNLIRFELGKGQHGDSPSDNVYTRAAEFLVEAQRGGVLQRDEAASIYAYVQKFTNPVQPEKTMVRSGVIVLGRIYDYAEKVVFRHEQTLAKPKADRVNLLKATRTHSGQLFMLYEDPANEVENILAPAIANRPPDVCLVDEYAVENCLWQIQYPATIDRVAVAMRDKRLIIADGHHRYETAREYRDACRTGCSDRNASHEFVMMTLINGDSPGLVVLPTHRVVFGLSGFEPWKLLRRLQEFFQVMPTLNSGADLLAEVAEAGRDRPAFAAVTQEGTEIARAIPEKVDAALSNISPLERRLDVLLLHEIVLHRVLKISPEAVREQRNVRYYRPADEAIREVANGADAAFLLNPVSISTMRELCHAGHVMPQKSTDFYPKLLSGLTLYNLDQGF